jgi:hypothetical protein
MFTRKKNMFFQCEIKQNLFDLNTSTWKNKIVFFPMWDKKIFWNNILNLIIYNIYNLYPHGLFLNFFYMK